MAVKKEVKKFKVGSVELEIGQKYILDHIPDLSAPEGMIKIGAKKFPFEGSGAMDCVYFDANKNLYDTGFYESSYCLSAYSQEEKALLVPIYQNQIRKPFEDFKNEDLNQSEKNEFWKDYRYEAFVNKEFDTSKPDDLFELFQIILQGLACEKNEKNPFYRKTAQFIIANPQITKNKKKEQAKTRMNALQAIATLADADLGKLNLLLQYVGRERAEKLDSEDIKAIYYEVINDEKAGLSFAESFTQALTEYETENGKEKMKFLHVVTELYKLKKIKKDRRGYVTEYDIFLGNSLKDIAIFCVQNDSVQFREISELVEQNPSVRLEVK